MAAESPAHQVTNNNQWVNIDSRTGRMVMVTRLCCMHSRSKNSKRVSGFVGVLVVC